MSVSTTSGRCCPTAASSSSRVGGEGRDLELGRPREQGRRALAHEVVVLREHEAQHHARTLGAPEMGQRVSDSRSRTPASGRYARLSARPIRGSAASSGNTRYSGAWRRLELRLERLRGSGSRSTARAWCRACPGRRRGPRGRRRPGRRPLGRGARRTGRRIRALVLEGQAGGRDEELHGVAEAAGQPPHDVEGPPRGSPPPGP